MLTFLDFCTEENYDFVNIYDGTGFLITSLSGCPPALGSYTSYGRSMLVEFISDVSISYRGFTAVYEAVSRELQHALRD